MIHLPAEQLANLHRLAPEVVLCVFGIVIMFADPFVSAANRKVLGWLGFCGALGALASVHMAARFPGRAYSNLINVDHFSIFVHVVVIGAVALAILGSLDYLDQEGIQRGETGRGVPARPLGERAYPLDGLEQVLAFLAAQRFAEEVLGVMMLWLGILTVAGIVFMPELMVVLAPGFAEIPAKFALAVRLTRITFPYLMLICLTAAFASVLNGLHRFAAAAAAFLVRNFPPARIFMGDVGSVPLGFLAGALGLIGWNDGVWPLWFPLLVFAPFVCDATLTLLKRLARGERAWQAHREHYYQRLVRMGFGHRGAALIEYAAMLGCAAAAVYANGRGISVQVAVIGASIVILGGIAVWVDLRWSRFVRESGIAA